MAEQVIRSEYLTKIGTNDIKTDIIDLLTKIETLLGRTITQTYQRKLRNGYT